MAVYSEAGDDAFASGETPTLAKGGISQLVKEAIREHKILSRIPCEIQLVTARLKTVVRASGRVRCMARHQGRSQSNHAAAIESRGRVD